MAHLPTDGPDSRAYRVLTLLPTRRDARVTQALLQRASVACAAFEAASSLAPEITHGVGAILLTDFAFSDPHFDRVALALSAQPPWSDIPVIVLCQPAPLGPKEAQWLESLRNVTLLEWPSSARTLLSSVQTALRARVGQYALRDQFDALSASEASLRRNESQFRTMLDTIPQLAWMARADGYIYWYNRRWYEYTGTIGQETDGVGWQNAHDPSHQPEVLERWRAAIATGKAFDMEYPLRAADGHFRTHLTLVVPMKDEAGRVLRWFGTDTDIEEATRTELQLRGTQAELRDADRRKDVFLATLAHELRNPLAPIRAAAQVLASPRLAPQQLQWAQQVIQRQVGHMAMLLDDLLDIARITQAKLELKKVHVRLTEVLDAAVEAAQPLIDGKHHHLSVTLPSDHIALQADPLRLSQIFSNLLSNAAKYTDPGGHIELVGSIRNDTLQISVRDDGIGIARTALGRIFEMFSQIEGGSLRTEGGLGIGLALVKGLVDLHGGTIEAHSEGPGCGSEFQVRIPLTASDTSGSDATTSDAPPVVVVGRRVMVADDNRDAADALALLLQLSGHEVRVAHGGRAALAIAKTFRPEVALMDIGMPDLDGCEVARKIRQEPWGGDIRLIALTGWGGAEDRRRALSAGFDQHLTKPLNPAWVETLLARAADLPIAPRESDSSQSPGSPRE